MLLLGGYKIVDMTNQRIGTGTYTLQNISNLHLNTSIEESTLETNYGWSAPFNDTNIIQGNWPTQLRRLDLGTQNNIATLFKSFNGFATIEATTQFYFRWFCQAPASVDSVSFILRDIITGTTKIAGTLSFGTIAGSNISGMVYPLSTRDDFTKACYNCLVANTPTACSSLLSSSNALTSNVGRGFSVLFGQVT
jgi:hypothetical protein